MTQCSIGPTVNRSDCPIVRASSRFARLAGAAARLVQRARPLVRPARRAAPDRRPGAGPAGRQPHRPALHRRLCRRPALRDADRLRLCPRRPMAPAPTTASTLIDARITNAVRCVPPENKPNGQEIAPAAIFCGHIADMPKLRRSSRSAAFPMTARWWRSAVRGSASLRSWRDPSARRAHAVRQLSLLALQHEHRRADAARCSARSSPPCAAISTRAARRRPPRRSCPAETPDRTPCVMTPSSMTSAMRLISVMPSTSKVGRSSARVSFNSASERIANGRCSRSAASRW